MASRVTKRGSPPTVFLSLPMAESTAARAVPVGAAAGNPKSRRSAVSRDSSSPPSRPATAAMRASATIPTATAAPCGSR